MCEFSEANSQKRREESLWSTVCAISVNQLVAIQILQLTSDTHIFRATISFPWRLFWLRAHWLMLFRVRAQELASLPLWTSSAEGDFIVRSFVAKNFVAAMAFLNGVAEIAEEQGHHPDLHLTQYRNIEIRLHTHSMGGEEGTCTHCPVALGRGGRGLTPAPRCQTQVAFASYPVVRCRPRSMYHGRAVGGPQSLQFVRN